MPTVPKSAVYGRAERPPPVRVNPPDEARDVTERPPEKVEVAVLVMRREPPEIESPVEEFREVRESPPDQVDVAVEVLVMEPPVKASPPVTPKLEAVMPPTKDDVAAPVTAMIGVMMEEVAKSPETVVLPEIETFPATAKVVPGVAVPTPTLPEIFSITKLPDFTFNPPAKVEVELLLTMRLVTVVEPPSNPPPPPQLMQILPTLKLPTTFK